MHMSATKASLPSCSSLLSPPSFHARGIIRPLARTPTPLLTVSSRSAFSRPAHPLPNPSPPLVSQSAATPSPFPDTLHPTVSAPVASSAAPMPAPLSSGGQARAGTWSSLAAPALQLTAPSPLSFLEADCVDDAWFFAL
mmetsp:Transcript_21700/g.37277  ORF Transcript_21700/g.37277 Transcript_21700/m.37277 type:complete len:139 (-) Transcript_21700:11-427(-)